VSLVKGIGKSMDQEYQIVYEEKPEESAWGNRQAMIVTPACVLFFKGLTRKLWAE